VTTTTDRPQPRTAAALAARRRDTQAALDRMREAITRFRRDKTPVTIAAVASRRRVQLICVVVAARSVARRTDRLGAVGRR
jgi:hypothetical protein